MVAGILGGSGGHPALIIIGIVVVAAIRHLLPDLLPTRVEARTAASPQCDASRGPRQAAEDRWRVRRR